MQGNRRLDSRVARLGRDETLGAQPHKAHGGGTQARTQRTGGAAPGVARDIAQARGGLESSAHPPRRRVRHALTRSRGSEQRRPWVSRDRRRSSALAGLAPTSAHLLPALRWPRSGSRSASSPELAITGENHWRRPRDNSRDTCRALVTRRLSCQNTEGRARAHLSAEGRSSHGGHGESGRGQGANLRRCVGVV